MRRAIAVLFFLLMSGSACAQAQDALGSSEVYRLGPEDVLQIQIWGRPDLTGSIRIDFSGLIQLPLVGEIRAEGRTVESLSQSLTERYQLLDPSIREVMVAVTEYNSRSVTVLGEVRNPGRHWFRLIPDLWTVILTAGGATSTADLALVQLVRRDELSGVTRTQTVDLSQGIKDTPRSTLPGLNPGDTIIVPPADATVVPSDRFQVLGAVRTPGTYRISTADRVVEALSIAGGALANADLSKVQLTRVTPDGVVSYDLDMEGYLYDARPMADLGLIPGDTITVPAKQSPMNRVLEGLMRLAPIVSAALSIALLSR